MRLEARKCDEINPLATSAPGQPGPRAVLTKVQRHADQQAGHGPLLGIQGKLFSLLALQIRDLVYGEPRRLILKRDGWRWSGLRLHEAIACTSSQTSEPIRQRYRAELGHTLCWLSRTITS